MSTQRLGKRLAYVLRHKPESVGLTLNSEGWVPVTALCSALQITEESLLEVVKEDSKQRFTVREGKIRAAQGHSVPVEISFTRGVAPEWLWHGTTEEALPSILTEGLKPMSRTHVHLSASRETAEQVGSRHKGRLVVLKIHTTSLTSEGHELLLSENGVWLTDHVPATSIEVLA